MGDYKMMQQMRKMRRRHSCEGFTMMELMLTIGILAIALTMVSGLFPVAVRENNESYKDVVGTLICENGLAVAKTILTDGNVPSSMGVIFDEDNGTGLLAKNAQHYNAQFEKDSSDVWINQGFRDGTDNNGNDPSDLNDDEKMRGFLVLGRRTSGSNQLVIVSYARNSGNRVTAESVSCDVLAGSTTITDGGSELRIGSPLIDRDTGCYATIIAASGTTGKLNRPIHPSGGDNVSSAYVIQESGEPTKSPALSVLVTLTGLQD